MFPPVASANPHVPWWRTWLAISCFRLPQRQHVDNVFARHGRQLSALRQRVAMPWHSVLRRQLGLGAEDMNMQPRRPYRCVST